MSVNQEIGTSVSKKGGTYGVSYQGKEGGGVGGFECRGDTMEDTMIIDFCKNFVWLQAVDTWFILNGFFIILLSLSFEHHCL